MHLTFEWICNAADFRALEPCWQRLCARTAGITLFQTFAWQWRAWQHVASAQGRQLRILVGRVDERVVLIWPLVLDSGTVRFLACDQTEYRDVLVEVCAATDAWLDAALDQVIALPGGRRVVLFDVRGDAQLARLMCRRTPAGFRVNRQTWLIRLDRWRSWDAYATHLPNRLRSDQRRQWRRVAALPGEVRFAIVTDRAEILDGVDWFFRHKSQWLKDRDVAAPSFTCAAYQEFLKATVAAMHDRGQLVLGKLASATDILSLGFGYTFQGAFIFQGYAYNAAFHSVSPSRLLLEQLIRWCLEHGIDEFDFLPWDMPYKAQWSDASLAVHDYVLPLSLLARLKCELQALGLGRVAGDQWLMRQYRRLPARMRDVLRETVVADWDNAAAVERMRRREVARVRYESGSPT
jgi:CelD/BcsL family acetyltransferase involved in cellulose biosynthesis